MKNVLSNFLTSLKNSELYSYDEITLLDNNFILAKNSIGCPNEFSQLSTKTLEKIEDSPLTKSIEMLDIQNYHIKNEKQFFYDNSFSYLSVVDPREQSFIKKTFDIKKDYLNNVQTTNNLFTNSGNKNFILVKMNKRVHYLFNARRKKVIIKHKNKNLDRYEELATVGLSTYGEHIVFASDEKLIVHDLVNRREIINEKLKREDLVYEEADFDKAEKILKDNMRKDIGSIKRQTIIYSKDKSTKPTTTNSKKNNLLQNKSMDYSTHNCDYEANETKSTIKSAPCNHISICGNEKQINIDPNENLRASDDKIFVVNKAKWTPSIEKIPKVLQDCAIDSITIQQQKQKNPTNQNKNTLAQRFKYEYKKS